MTCSEKVSPCWVFIVSDATGETANRVVKAALAQFGGVNVQIERRGGVRSEEGARAVAREAAKREAMIVHTLVMPAVRYSLTEESRVQGVECVDLIGPLMLHLTDWLKTAPLAQPGLVDQLDEAYFRRIGALEFAVRHDDGRNPDELAEADLVLVGVSRVSKTPLSFYLAYRGWMVGNVPIVLGIEPPPILFKLPKHRIVALSVQPERMVTLRRQRLGRMPLSGSYANPEHVREEYRYAHEIFKERGRWPVVDVTVKSIEESASEVLELVRQARRRVS
jgi:regulator of PEP synthase PpsR (kinase-PPPase family)